MSELIPLEDWAAATTTSMEEVAMAALGLESCSTRATEAEASDADCGGYIPLLTDHESVQIGLATDFASCLRMARLLLVLDEADPDPPMSEVRDAMAELANMLAGAIKTRVGAGREGAAIQLGLPFFVHGRISPVAGLVDSVMRFESEAFSCDIHVMHLAHPRKLAA